MINKKMLSVLVASILLMPIGSSMYLAYGKTTQGNKDPSDTYDKLLGLFEKSNSTVVRALLSLEDQNLTVPDAVITNYNNGLYFANESIQLRAKLNFTGATESLMLAMQYMKQAMRGIEEDFGEVETEEEEEISVAYGILETASRLNNTINRLEDIAEEAEASGINASAVRIRLALLRERLLRLRERIIAGNLTEAAGELNSSKLILGQVMAALNAIKKAYRINQTIHFLDIVEKRLLKSYEVISKHIENSEIPGWVKNLTAEHAKHGLQIGINRILTLRTLLLEGKLNETIIELQELKDNLAEVLSEAEKYTPQIGKILSDIYEFEVSINMYENMSEMLSEKGINTSIVQSKIQEARNLVSEGIDALEEGNITLARDNFNQAADLVRDIKVLLAQIREKE